VICRLPMYRQARLNSGASGFGGQECLDLPGRVVWIASAGVLSSTARRAEEDVRSPGFVPQYDSKCATSNALKATSSKTAATANAAVGRAPTPTPCDCCVCLSCILTCCHYMNEYGFETALYRCGLLVWSTVSFCDP
jgi:hypothetical protein